MSKGKVAKEHASWAGSTRNGNAEDLFVARGGRGAGGCGGGGRSAGGHGAGGPGAGGRGGGGASRRGRGGTSGTAGRGSDLGGCRPGAMGSRGVSKYSRPDGDSR